MNNKLKTREVSHFIDAIMTLRDKDEYYKFFEDICTVKELLSIAERYEVARMLKEGKTYLDISNDTGASTATISRVNRSLNYGADGYEIVFKRLGIPENEEAQSL